MARYGYMCLDIARSVLACISLSNCPLFWTWVSTGGGCTGFCILLSGLGYRPTQVVVRNTRKIRERDYHDTG